MLLFHKRDLLVVLTKSDDTVQFSKPIKDILKYQYRYNYKFKMYESGRVTVADDYIIEGETLTVFFGSASVEYTSSGATYNDGGSGGEGGGEESTECNCQLVTETKFGDHTYEQTKYTFYYLDLLPEDTETNKIYFQSIEGFYAYASEIGEGYIDFFSVTGLGTLAISSYSVFHYSDFDFIADLPESFNELEGKLVRVEEQSVIG